MNILEINESETESTQKIAASVLRGLVEPTLKIGTRTYRTRAECGLSIILTHADCHNSISVLQYKQIFRLDRGARRGKKNLVDIDSGAPFKKIRTLIQYRYSKE